MYPVLRQGDSLELLIEDSLCHEVRSLIAYQRLELQAKAVVICTVCRLHAEIASRLCHRCQAAALAAQSAGCCM